MALHVNVTQILSGFIEIFWTLVFFHLFCRFVGTQLSSFDYIQYCSLLQYISVLRNYFSSAVYFSVVNIFRYQIYFSISNNFSYCSIFQYASVFYYWCIEYCVEDFALKGEEQINTMLSLQKKKNRTMKIIIFSYAPFINAIKWKHNFCEKSSWKNLHNLRQICINSWDAEIRNIFIIC